MTSTTAAPSVAVVTAAGPGALSALAVLSESVAHHLPGAVVWALVPTAAGRIPGVELIGLEELATVGIDRAELHRRAAFSRPDELLASLKPALLALTRARGHDVVIWLDPDVELHSNLDPLAELAAAHGVALVATTTAPPPLDGLRLADADLLTTGLVSTSIVAVADGSGPFLEWWAHRAARHCLLDPPANLLLDRRWLETALVLFAAPLVDDVGVGVSYANLH